MVSGAEARDGNDAVIVEALHYRSEAVRRIERAAGTHLPICTPAGFAVPITELGAVVGVLALAVVDLTEHTLLDHCADKLKFGHIAVVLCVHIYLAGFLDILDKPPKLIHGYCCGNLAHNVLACLKRKNCLRNMALHGR